MNVSSDPWPTRGLNSTVSIQLLPHACAAVHLPYLSSPHMQHAPCMYSTRTRRSGRVGDDPTQEKIVQGNSSSARLYAAEKVSNYRPVLQRTVSLVQYTSNTNDGRLTCLLVSVLKPWPPADACKDRMYCLTQTRAGNTRRKARQKNRQYLAVMYPYLRHPGSLRLRISTHRHLPWSFEAYAPSWARLSWSVGIASIT